MKKLVQRHTIIFMSIIFTSTAFAQQQQPSNPQEQIERTIGSLFVANITLTAQLATAQAQIADLKKQLEAEKQSGAKNTGK